MGNPRARVGRGGGTSHSKGSEASNAKGGTQEGGSQATQGKSGGSQPSHAKGVGAKSKGVASQPTVHRSQASGSRGRPSVAGPVSGQGKKDTSRTRISSASSTPTTVASSPPSVNLRRLPPQYPTEQDQNPGAFDELTPPPLQRRRISVSLGHQPPFTPPAQPQFSVPQSSHHQQATQQNVEVEDNQNDEAADDDDIDEDGEDVGEDEDGNGDGDVDYEDVNLTLQDLLNTKGRDQYLQTLSPHEGQGLW